MVLGQTDRRAREREAKKKNRIDKDESLNLRNGFAQATTDSTCCVSASDAHVWRKSSPSSDEKQNSQRPCFTAAPAGS